MRVILRLLLVSSLAVLQACSPAYMNGPVMNQQDIAKSFQPILTFMNARPGMVFADVGASSGALSVMMTTLMDSTKVYIQDIDATRLQAANLDKIIDFYSRQSGQHLRKKNEYHLVIGDPSHSNLPDAAFDLIYSNATVHAFSTPDSMLEDLRGKLKPGGMLFIRDCFKNDHGAGNVCSDQNCGRPLKTISEFLALMDRNGFQLKKQSPDMSGYPLFGFAFKN